MANSNILSIQSMLANGFTGMTSGRTFVGIDFGTSTTVVTVASFDASSHSIRVKPIMLKQLLEDGTVFHSEKMPSVIAWYKNKLFVGEGASNLKYILEKGKNIWYSFKMEIGEDLGAKYFNSEIADKQDIRIRNPKDCVRVFFMYLKILLNRYCADNNLSADIRYAVSIPASFEANQRKELMEALETNGMSLNKQSLIDEPNAAFISYVHESQASGSPLLISPHYNSKVLVFDFGAGTCDISILEIGKAANGLYSKNVAISKFIKLGGDDVDRFITYHFLMPRFLKANGFSADDFITKERCYIATQLYKVAERLKILVCKKLSALMYNVEIPQYAKVSTEFETISVPVNVETTKGILSQSTFSLSPAELNTAMSVFMRDSQLPSSYKGEDDYNSIFMPIKSAIAKANVRMNEIDYVLLIGGSAQNPFIQNALKDYFADSKILIPQDLQTHVSQGAAIHSLLLNGMNKSIIQPITSEPIFVITKDAGRKILMPAGATIPSQTVVVDDLVTAIDRQPAIELPICVGSENKMLYVLKITKDGGFAINTQVRLAIEITADKLLLARAECMGIDCMVEPQNPFANKELTTEERVILAAERLANLEAENNGGHLTQNGFVNLRNAYLRAGDSFKAAETLEQQLQMYPDHNMYHTAGVLYNNSGNYAKAMDFYERGLARNPNSADILFSIGHCILSMCGDVKRAAEYLRKAYALRKNHAPTLCDLGDAEAALGNHDIAKTYRQTAYDMLHNKWKASKLDDYEYGWLACVASDLGFNDVASSVRQSKPRVEHEKLFSDDNLTRTKAFELESK